MTYGTTNGGINAIGNVPPSTLAAQIVQNFETTSHEPRRSTKAHVQELLKLLLEDVHQNRATQKSFEAFEENCRLLTVIVKICLENIANDHPFQEQDSQQGETCQCLEVIQLTVRKHPEAILSPQKGPFTRDQTSFPLFTWLVPNLVFIRTRTISSDIQDAATKALAACIDVQAKPVTASIGLQPITRFLQGCISDIISRITAFEDFGDASLGPSAGELPSANTLAGFSVDDRNGPNLLHCTDFVSSREDLATFLWILSVNVPLHTVADKTENGWWFPHTVWIIESITALLSQPWAEKLHASLADQSSASLSHILRACIMRSVATQDLVSSRTSTQLACQHLALVLRSTSSSLSASSDIAACLLIACIVQTAQTTVAVLQLYSEHLQAVVEEALLDEQKTFTPDLQRALVCLKTLSSTDRQPQALSLDYDSLLLKQVFDRVLLPVEHKSLDEPELRPYKRLRSLDEHATLLDQVRNLLDREIDDIFDLGAASKMNRIQIAKESFKKLSSDHQCQLLSKLADAVCAVAMKTTVLEPCSSCKNGRRPVVSSNHADPTLLDEVHEVLEVIVVQAHEQRHVMPRIASLTAVQRILSHSNNPQHFELKSTVLGQVCFQSLTSTVRDVRFAALSAIECFFETEIDQETLRQNRLACLNVWRSLAEVNDLMIQETCICGLGLLSKRTDDEDEVNIVLLGLLEYLGHPNAFISSLAFEELSKLAAFENKTVWQLLEPYWRTLAVSVVKSLNSRPQIAQSVCDLLSISVSDLLKRTQFFTIPYLVFKGQTDVLQKIAAANGPEVTVHALCFQHGQLASILCFLLLQPSEDSDRLIVKSVAKACGGTDMLTLSDLLKCDTMYMAYELLRAAGEDEGNTKTRALHLVQVLADLSQDRVRSSRSSQAPGKENIGAFFKTWALAIVQLLSETITNAKGVQATFERKRCIGALSVMAGLAGERLGHALPQIRSCLQFAIEDTKLRNNAFLAWFALLEGLDAAHIAVLLDQTLALLVNYWTSLSEPVQTRAHDTISLVFKNHPTAVSDKVQTLPSLAGIPLLRKFESELAKLRKGADARVHLTSFAARCQSETTAVVSAGLSELELYLTNNWRDYQAMVINEQPDPMVGSLARALLDCCVRFKEQSDEIAVGCAKCLGLLGCLDPFRVDTPREKKEMFVLWNFVDTLETVDFVLFFLKEILVKVYLATTITNRQQILAFGMQELLKVCDMDAIANCRRGAPDERYRRWISIDEPTRDILKPFLTSKYVINAPALAPVKSYPIYSKGMKYGRWIHDFVIDTLQRGKGNNALLVFNICRRLVRNQDTSIANFLLPYVALNIVVEGSKQDNEDIIKEFEAVLATPLTEMDSSSRQHLIQCSQSMFSVIDYLSRWVQEKRRSLAGMRSRAPSKEHQLAEPHIQRIEILLSDIPADVMSSRAADCQSFSRSLFYWEQHMRKEQAKSKDKDSMRPFYERLQDIYAKIDEPDGIEGLSSCLDSTDIEQQLLEDRNAGRWSAIQSWYELQLSEDPEDTNAHLNLVKSLRESGQHEAILTLETDLSTHSSILPQLGSYAVEAAWSTSNFLKLEKYVKALADGPAETFNVGVGALLGAYGRSRRVDAESRLQSLLLESTRTLTFASTATLQGCHDTMLKFHVLFELGVIIGQYELPFNKTDLVQMLDHRFEMLNSFPSDQKYLLGIRRAAMQLRGAPKFNTIDETNTLLKAAKLARKEGFSQQALHFTFRAMQEGSPPAQIEYAKLMWDDGQHRRAIQTLEDAVENKAFEYADSVLTEPSETATITPAQQNHLSAKAHLSLAKWIDESGQTASKATVERYRKATQLHPKWEKGYYLLGKHYNELLESEKANAPEKQAQTFITGEMAKLVIENFLRAAYGGTKYIYQTLPKLLTLWLDLGAEVEEPLNQRYGDKKFREHTEVQRKKIYGTLLKTVERYVNTRLPAYTLYTAFSQVVARIVHPNKEVYLVLVEIIVKVIAEHPQQAIWPILAMMKSRAGDRGGRGLFCKNRALEQAKQYTSDRKRNEILDMFATGQKLTEQLVELCDKPVDQQLKNPVSLRTYFGFAHKKTTPCRLVIPIESTLLAKLPPASNPIRNWDAFKDSVVTIDSFHDDATVLSSLAKPRKVKIRGSNGKFYSLLCKPKDDLRKDQRLLEFNSMISRILKLDAECSKRRLYIKTYAVTPLNEECGLIEWVEGMRTLRDILLSSYRQMGISIDYDGIRMKLNSITNDQSQVHIFSSDILSHFPPMLHDWFVDQFREPDVWFNARLRYTRSCAVMSMVGHVLGLGDRHGENILLEEAAGGTFHVDFNCLFDKGKTFETPERVPFRLTHNMVDAFGAYRENGPFRKSCELTMGILKQNEDTLMTILETFLYDPTQDFIGKRKHRQQHEGVPTTPQDVLESVRRKVRGLLPLESVPLSVEGYVNLQIQEAMDHYNLARMYIGWSAFL